MCDYLNLFWINNILLSLKLDKVSAFQAISLNMGDIERYVVEVMITLVMLTFGDQDSLVESDLA